MLKMPILKPTLQLGFYQRLIEAEQSYLLPALLNISSRLNIGELDQELLKFAGNEKLSYLASRGLRGELAFPVPCLLKARPVLLAYYRLLFGFSQKEFFKGPFSRFKKMEADNQIPQSIEGLLDDLCSSLIESSWLLINGLPNLSQELLNSLTLLTLGPQFRGSRNVNLGAEANRSIFALIKSIVMSDISGEGPTHLEITNGVGRVYRIEFSPDPDIAIRQILQDGTYRKGSLHRDQHNRQDGRDHPRHLEGGHPFPCHQSGQDSRHRRVQ
jgi:hypothetical protein